MSVTRSRVCKTAAMALALAVFSSPATAQKPPPEPDFLDESFSSALVDQLAVLPVADLRLEKSIKLERMDLITQRTVRRMLKKSPYTIVHRSAPRHEGTGTRDDLEYPDATWVAGLGEAEDRWVLLIVVQDITKKRTLGSAFGVVCGGYLFDKEAGREVWRHESVGSMGHGGLSGLALSGAARTQAFEICLDNLLRTFPERKGGR